MAFRKYVKAILVLSLLCLAFPTPNAAHTELAHVSGRANRSNLAPWSQIRKWESKTWIRICPRPSKRIKMVSTRFLRCGLAYVINIFARKPGFKTFTVTQSFGWNAQDN